MEFFDLTFSDKRSRIGPIAMLDHLVDDACAGRGGQLTQFIEGVGSNQYRILHRVLASGLLFRLRPSLRLRAIALALRVGLALGPAKPLSVLSF